MFLKSICNFKALAILLIVAGHLYGYGFTGEGAISSVVKNIITGGTALFVFISGFMFHYVFFKRFEYKKFMVNKVKNVVTPYFLLSTIAIIGLFLASSGYFSAIGQMSNDSYESMYQNGIIFNPSDSTLITIIKYYLSGRVLTAYWYIPFVFLVFATSPLHMKFIGLNLKNQLVIIFILSIISMFVHRPVAVTNPVHSLIYYTPIYLIGILVSMYSCKVKQYFDNKLFYLALLVFLISYLEYLSGHQGNYHKPFFEYAGVDLQYIQKIFLIFFFYIFFEKFSFESKVVDIISNTSFAIFFIHPWVMYILGKVVYVYEIKIIDENFLYYISTVIFVVFLSVFSALILKKIFNVHSKKTRYIMGY